MFYRCTANLSDLAVGTKTGVKVNRYDDANNFLPVLQGEVIDEERHAPTWQHLANVAMSGRGLASRAQQSDTAITHSTAFLIASAPVVGSLGLVTSGLCLMGWLVAGGPAVLWVSVELLLLGASAFVALGKQRRAGLEHTPAGVERHDISERAKVAMHVVDRHCEMVERLKGVRK